MKPVLLAIALLGLAAPALAQTQSQPRQPRPEQASIPFVNTGAIRSYRPVSDTTVYIEDNRRQWYRADLFGPCFGIRDGIAIGVTTPFGGTLDNTSSFLVGRQRCPIESLVRSGPPPGRNQSGSGQGD